MRAAAGGGRLWEAGAVVDDLEEAMQARTLTGKVLVVVHKEHGFRALLHTLVTLLGGGEAVRCLADGAALANTNPDQAEAQQASMDEVRHPLGCALG
jgi:hypothetical protein